MKWLECWMEVDNVSALFDIYKLEDGKYVSDRFPEGNSMVDDLNNYLDEPIERIPIYFSGSYCSIVLGEGSEPPDGDWDE